MWTLLEDNKLCQLSKVNVMSGVKRRLSVDETETKQQFTAANILKSAYESSINELKTPDFHIADLDELHYFQQRKRTEYENALRRNRFNYGQWMRYAQFEIDQKDLRRARSVFERALEVDYKNVSMWVRYIQVEIKNKNINHARNLLERATKLLPRVDKLWYMYITIEETIGNIVAVNEIFENWLQWKPVKDVWIHYIEYKERYGEYEDERLLFEKFVTTFCESETWLRWTTFEKKHGDFTNVENVFKLGVNALFAKNNLTSQFLIAWIQFEHSHKKFEKVRELYKFGFKALNAKETHNLQKFQTDFEKQYGVDNENVEKYVLLKRKVVYEDQLAKVPTDYETWWTYFNLLIDSELEISNDKIREKFENALGNIPQDLEHQHWVPYCYLSYRFALWEEYENNRIDNAKRIYEKLIKLIPHKKITIIDVWYKYADFELRNFDVTAMRKVLGQAIGLASNEDIILHYIMLEIKLKYFDRARKLFNKLIELYPKNWKNWLEYFGFEDSLGNDVRSSNIIEISIFENFLSPKDKVKMIGSVVDQLIENYNFNLARRLYEYKVELMEQDVGAMIERCLFELKVPSQKQIEAYDKSKNNGTDQFAFVVDEDTKNRVRNEYDRFLKVMKYSENVQKRIVLLESWKKFEEQYGDTEKVESVVSRLPKIIRKTRSVEGEDFQEEYIEYVFPEDVKEIQEQVDEFEAEFVNELQVGIDNEKEEYKEDDDVVDEEDEAEDDASDGANAAKAKAFHSRFASDSEGEEADQDEDDNDNDDNDEADRTSSSFRGRFEE